MNGSNRRGGFSGWVRAHPGPAGLVVVGGLSAIVLGSWLGTVITATRDTSSPSVEPAASAIVAATVEPTPLAPFEEVSPSPTPSPSPSPSPTVTPSSGSTAEPSETPTSETSAPASEATPAPSVTATPRPAATPAPTAVALPPAVEGFGRIAWGSSADSDSSDIVVSNGVDAYRVVATEAEERNPVWSPDGEWLAYISSEAGGSVNVVGPDGVRTVHGGGYPRSSYYTDGIAWSPDSTRLALALVTGGIKVVDLDGETVGEIAAREPRHVAWSPSGDLLAFTSRRELIVADMASGETRVVVSMDSNVRFPMWLRDATTIVFHGYTEAGNTDLFTVALDGSALRNVTATSDLFEDVPALSPDGSRIALVVDDGAERWVELMNADGTQRVRTATDMSGLGAPTWSPDGTQLVVADGTSIFVVPLESGLPSYLHGEGTAPNWGRYPD